MVEATDLGAIETTAATKKVWKHHIDAWGAGDLDEIMKDYSEDSIFVGNSEVYKGIDAIRGVFARLFEIFGNGENDIDPEVIRKELIYITWNFTPTGDVSYFGTDSFIVENGVITYQTVASPLYEKYPIG